MRSLTTWCQELSCNKDDSATKRYSTEMKLRTPSLVAGTLSIPDQRFEVEDRLLRLVVRLRDQCQSLIGAGLVSTNPTQRSIRIGFLHIRLGLP